MVKLVTYGNGTTVNYVYDKLDRVSKITYNKGNTVEATYLYEYDSNGNLTKITDSTQKRKLLYKYDMDGRMTGFINVDTNTNSSKLAGWYTYDEELRISNVTYMHEYVVSGTSTYNLLQNYRYSYDAKGRLSSLEIEHNIGTATKGYGVVPQYDGLGRLKSKETKITGNTGNTLVSNTGTYTYTTSSTGQSTQVSQYAYKINGTTANTFNYTYDANGNITAIKNAAGTVVFRYTYDTLGRLTREDNKDANKTYVYAYDNAGNITSKKTYAFTTGTPGTVQSTNTYTYGNTSWKDQLTKFNGTALTYDAIGNPITYNNGTGMTFTWKKGRELATAVKGSNSVTYGYDDTGLRISKTVNGVEHKYYYDGDLLIYEEYGDDMLIYIYDENGSPIGFKYRTKSYAVDNFDSYIYAKNLQGEIVAIYNTSGTVVVTYTYDAWGNVTTTGSLANTIGAYNPLRYRGYYYDTETGLYYLQTRYYDPVTGRFINADAYIYNDLHGLNLYAYCYNNPVRYYDPYGMFVVTLSLIATSAYYVLLGTGIVATAMVVAEIENETHLLQNGIENIYDNIADLFDKENDGTVDAPQNITDEHSQDDEVDEKGDLLLNRDSNLLQKMDI